MFTLIVGWLWRSAEDARSVADQARGQEELAKNEAVESLAQAIAAADTWLIQVSNDLRYYPGLGPMYHRLLNQAAHDYKQIGEKHSDDPKLIVQYARSTIRLGDVYMLIGKLDEALTSFETAEKVFESLSDEHDDQSSRQLDLAKCRLGQGLVLSLKNHPKESREKFDSAITMLKALPQDAEVRDAQARAMVGLAGLLNNPDEADQKIELLRKSIDTFKQLAENGERDGNPKYRNTLTDLLKELGQVLLTDSANKEDALVVFRDAVKFYDKLIADNAGRPDYVEGRAQSQTNLGIALDHLGHEAEAEQAFHAAVSDFEQTADMLTDMFSSETLAIAYYQVGVRLQKKGQAVDARYFLEQARDEFGRQCIIHKQAPSTLRSFAEASTALGSALRQLKDPEYAAEVLDGAAQTYNRLAQLAKDSNQEKEAAEYARKAKEVKQQIEQR